MVIIKIEELALGWLEVVGSHTASCFGLLFQAVFSETLKLLVHINLIVMNFRIYRRHIRSVLVVIFV